MASRSQKTVDEVSKEELAALFLNFRGTCEQVACSSQEYLDEGLTGRMGYTIQNPQGFVVSMSPAAPLSLWVKGAMEGLAALLRILCAI